MVILWMMSDTVKAPTLGNGTRTTRDFDDVQEWRRHFHLVHGGSYTGTFVDGA